MFSGDGLALELAGVNLPTEAKLNELSARGTTGRRSRGVSYVPSFNGTLARRQPVASVTRSLVNSATVCWSKNGVPAKTQ